MNEQKYKDRNIIRFWSVWFLTWCFFAQKNNPTYPFYNLGFKTRRTTFQDKTKVADLQFLRLKNFESVGRERTRDIFIRP